MGGKIIHADYLRKNKHKHNYISWKLGMFYKIGHKYITVFHRDNITRKVVLLPQHSYMTVVWLNMKTIPKITDFESKNVYKSIIYGINNAFLGP